MIADARPVVRSYARASVTKAEAWDAVNECSAGCKPLVLNGFRFAADAEREALAAAGRHLSRYHAQRGAVV